MTMAAAPLFVAVETTDANAPYHSLRLNQFVKRKGGINACVARCRA
jgi:hypothetical protein